MNPVYAFQPIPQDSKISVFLAGPTPRTATQVGWRPAALEIFRQLAFDGHVLIPEAEDGVWKNDYDGQVEWEAEGLTRCTVILFWIPRDMAGGMPALTTNDEWGYWKASGKVVLGTPPWADKVSYQRYYAKKLGVPLSDTLEDTIKQAISLAERLIKSK